METSRARRQQLIRQAEGYLELGMHQHALVVLDKLGETSDLEIHASYLRGESLRSLERYDEALDEFLRAAEAVPDDIHIWLAVGWCYKRSGRIDLAIEALDKALAIEPGEALIHYNLACYCSLAGDRAQALHFLRQAFDIDSHYRDLVDNEEDFDPIRQDPEFLALTIVIV